MKKQADLSCRVVSLADIRELAHDMASGGCVVTHNRQGVLEAPFLQTGIYISSLQKKGKRMPHCAKNPLQLITTQQAAKLTGHSTRTVRRWVRAGKLQPIELSRRIMFLEADLERLIESAHRSSQAAA
jgi:excisionase family DNA binding protein